MESLRRTFHTVGKYLCADRRRVYDWIKVRDYFEDLDYPDVNAALWQLIDAGIVERRGDDKLRGLQKGWGQ